MTRSTRKKIVQVAGFLALRTAMGLVLAVLVLFLYDIGKKGGGAISWEFLSQAPRKGMTEGGIFPAIFGTVMMVLLMSIIVTPLGVMAAVYMREYAKPGPLIRAIRISVNNLAGVPSIVYGVFGLGLFVYVFGHNLDQLFFAEALPTPTFGSPGLLWASLTLAILTLPVVIVSTEEGLSRVPRSIREGSLALGATKAETLWRTVLPIASPAMMTGRIAEAELTPATESRHSDCRQQQEGDPKVALLNYSPAVASVPSNRPLRN